MPSTNGGPIAAVVRKKAMSKAPAVGVADMLRIAPQSPFSCRGPYIVTGKDDNTPFAQIRLISNISNDISVSWEVSTLYPPVGCALACREAARTTIACVLNPLLLAPRRWT